MSVNLDHHTIKILVNSGNDVEAWLDAMSSVHDYNLYGRNYTDMYTFDGAYRVVTEGEMWDYDGNRMIAFAFIADTQEDAVRIYTDWEQIRYDQLSNC